MASYRILPSNLRLQRTAGQISWQAKALVCAASAVLIVWLSSGGSPYAGPVVLNTARSVSTDTAFRKGGDLTGMFPVASPVAVPVATPAAPADGLVLYGILGTGATGSAIVGETGADQRLFRVGRQIRPGIFLKAIAATSVILLRDGKRLELSLVNGGQSRLAMFDERETKAPVRDARRDVPIPAASVATARVVTPFVDGTGASRFQVSLGAGVPIFEAAGIRPGDIILTVNGRPFDSNQKAEALLHQQSTGATMIFGIERDGKQIAVSAAL